MEELSQKQRAQLKGALGDLKRQLESAIEGASDGAQTVELDGSIGRVTRVDALQQQSMAKASRELSRRRLESVKAALKEIDDEGYGECRSCGEPIPFARLLAKPEGRLCVECQEDLELGR